MAWAAQWERESARMKGWHSAGQMDLVLVKAMVLETELLSVKRSPLETTWAVRRLWAWTWVVVLVAVR